MFLVGVQQLPTFHSIIQLMSLPFTTLTSTHRLPKCFQLNIKSNLSCMIFLENYTRDFSLKFFIYKLYFFLIDHKSRKGNSDQKVTNGMTPHGPCRTVARATCFLSFHAPLLNKHLT